MASPVYRRSTCRPYLVWIDPWQGEVDSSSLLAAVAGDDILPDMAIGRMPVNSAEEMNIVVSKTLAYEQAAPQDWQRRLMFVADNTPDPAAAILWRCPNRPLTSMRRSPTPSIAFTRITSAARITYHARP